MAKGLFRGCDGRGGVDGGLGSRIALGMDEPKLAPELPPSPSGGVHLGHLLGGSSITFLPFRLLLPSPLGGICLKPIRAFARKLLCHLLACPFPALAAISSGRLLAAPALA